MNVACIRVGSYARKSPIKHQLRRGTSVMTPGWLSFLDYCRSHFQQELDFRLSVSMHHVC